DSCHQLDPYRQRQCHLIGGNESLESVVRPPRRLPDRVHPHGGVDDDHFLETFRTRARSRVRNVPGSNSNETFPSRVFNSSARPRLTTSRNACTTVSVLEVKPSTRRASSMSGGGMIRVVRI